MSEASLVCILPVAPVHRDPDARSERLSEILLGERFAVREAGSEWTFGVGPDGVVGAVASAALALTEAAPTHRVRRGVVQLFREPDLLAATGTLLPLNARVRLTGLSAPVRFPSGEEGSAMTELATGGWTTAQALAPIDVFEADLQTVAEGFSGAAYLHGGRTVEGVDGPGMVHAVFAACGRVVPRSLDAQRDFIAAAGAELAVGSAPFSVIYCRASCGFAFPDGGAVAVSASRMQVIRTTRARFFEEEAGAEAAFDFAPG